MKASFKINTSILPINTQLLKDYLHCKNFASYKEDWCYLAIEQIVDGIQNKEIKISWEELEFIHGSIIFTGDDKNYWNEIPLDHWYIRNIKTKEIYDPTIEQFGKNWKRENGKDWRYNFDLNTIEKKYKTKKIFNFTGILKEIEEAKINISEETRNNYKLSV